MTSSTDPDDGAQARPLRRTPEDLDREAAEAERLAETLSYGSDRSWLRARAEDLRRQAATLRARRGLPRGH